MCISRYDSYALLSILLESNLIPDCLSANKGENKCPTQFCFHGKVGGSIWHFLIYIFKKNFIVAPPPNLCTDNGAMIAFAGIEKVCSVDNFDTELCATSRSNWSVEE